MPCIKITCAAAELIPTVQYGNVMVGPVTVTRLSSTFDDDEDLLEKINQIQTV